MSSRNRRKPSTYTPMLDVMIPSSGRFDELSKCLTALRREAKAMPINVIVIDDGCNAEEKLNNIQLFDPEQYDEFSFQTKRLQNSVGFPSACNEGARMGNAPLIMFLNDDVELLDGAVEKVVRKMNEPDSQIGVLGIKLLFPPTSTSPIRPAGKVQHIGLSVNVRGDVIHPLTGWSADNPKCCISREVDMVTGACLTIRRTLFNQIGGFDLVYGRGTFDDAELCLRVKQKGLKIYLLADAIGYHYVGATAEKKQESFPLQMNSMIFKSRWAATGLLSWTDHLFY